MAKNRVVLNRKGFGEVMVSAGMEEQLRPFAEAVADRVAGATINPIRTGVGSANARIRFRVEGGVRDRADLIAAIRSVVGRAKEL